MSGLYRNRRILTKEFLEANYPAKTISEISQIARCDRMTIRKYLKMFGIPFQRRKPFPRMVSTKAMLPKSMLKEIERLNERATAILLKRDLLKMKYEALTGHDFAKESRLIEQIFLNHHSRMGESRDRELASELDRIAAEG